jgi:phosphoglycerate dehydrogenase-like enzyme
MIPALRSSSRAVIGAARSATPTSVTVTAQPQTAKPAGPLRVAPSVPAPSSVRAFSVSPKSPQVSGESRPPTVQPAGTRAAYEMFVQPKSPLPQPEQVKETMSSAPVAAAQAPAASRQIGDVPALASSVISISGPVLQIAPASQGWKSSKPDNVFLRTASSESELEQHLRDTQALTLIVGEDRITGDLLRKWRAMHPAANLVLARRGTSTDKIDKAACEALGITVINTPGVNSPHVARFVLKTLSRDGKMPSDVRLLGCGSVGSEVARGVCAESPSHRVTALTGTRTSHEALGLQDQQNQVALTPSMDEVFRGAHSLAICLPVTDDVPGRKGTRHSIGAEQIRLLAPGARIVCVSKPDVFDDAALIALAQSDQTLHLDYGPATLAEFRKRMKDLGHPVESWKCPPVLTSEPMKYAECAQDLDYAVNVKIATVQLGFLTQRNLERSWRIERGKAPEPRQIVHVRGAGISGLVIAAALAPHYNVIVHGRSAPEEGPSHKPVNMRHLSPTETSAKPVHKNPALNQLARAFVDTLNVGGIALFVEGLARDNPELAECIRQEGVVRVVPEGVPAGPVLDRHRKVGESIHVPGATPLRPVAELSREAFESRFGEVPGSSVAFMAPGYNLKFRDFMGELKALLVAAGVKFTDKPLEEKDLAALPPSAKVVSSCGVREPGTKPVVGWFFKARAAKGEGEAIEALGMKIQYPLPVEVMNCSRDGEYLLVSGGQVPPDASPAKKEEIRQQFLSAVQRHFPKTFAAAQESGGAEVFECARPGNVDGISGVQRDGDNRISVTETYAGGTTQSVELAAVAREMLAGAA